MGSKGIGILALVLLILAGIGLLIFSLCGGLSHAAGPLTAERIATPGPATRPADGLTYRTLTQVDPPLVAHVLTVDLSNPAVHVEALPAGPDPDGAGPWTTSLYPVRRVAGREKLAAAVNANFFRAKDAVEVAGESTGYFNGNAADVVGFAAHDGKSIGRPWGATLLIDAAGHARIGLVNFLPPGTREAVAGSHQILTRGRLTPPAGDTKRDPRTAAGLSADGQTLTLVVIDGRRPATSAGATLGELAAVMKQLGCADALNLDGGGSSTIVLAGPDGPRVVNAPSDGAALPFGLTRERPVANVLGVRVDAAKKD